MAKWGQILFGATMIGFAVGTDVYGFVIDDVVLLPVGVDLIYQGFTDKSILVDMLNAVSPFD